MMNRIDALLQKLCPNGVEYKKLSRIATISRGGNFQKKDFLTEGVPCIHYGQIYTKYGLFADKTFTFISEECAKKQKLAQPNDIVMAVTSENVEDVCKCLAWLGNEPVAISGHTAIIHHTQNAKYLVYYFHSQMFFEQKIKLTHGTKVVEVTPDTLANIVLPVPPLEIQREIVRILDNFTELTAELTARNTQYSYYRNKLLTFHTDVEIVPLVDIADIGTGNSNTNEEVENGKYPFFVRSQEPLRKNDYEYDETAIITAGDGVGVGKVYHYIEGKYALHQRAYRIHINTPKVEPRYYFHYMKAKFLPYIQKTMFQGSVASIRRPMLNAFPVPVPPIEVQNRIVDVLDNFEKICSDLNIGLPAEIEARQKQYEYYRDKLLTFAENSGTIVSRAEQSRAEQSRALIKLLQYVFGYARIPLRDVGSICMCKRILKNQTNTVSGVPFYKIGTFEKKADAYISQETFDEYRKKYNFPKKGDVLISAAGTIGRTVVYDGMPAYFQDSNIVWIDNDESLVLNSYLRYCYELKPWKASVGGTIPRLYNDNIAKAVIAVPSIEEQKRIVSILERFDKICTDMTAGLPAEIESRQKQYEYYRDKLLSF